MLNSMSWGYFLPLLFFFSFPHFENAALLYPIRNYLAQYDSNHCVAQTKLQKSVFVFARNCAVSLCLQMPWVWTSDIFYFWVRIYSSSFCIVGKKYIMNKINRVFYVSRSSFWHIRVHWCCLRLENNIMQMMFSLPRSSWATFFDV